MPNAPKCPEGSSPKRCPALPSPSPSMRKASHHRCSWCTGGGRLEKEGRTCEYRASESWPKCESSTPLSQKRPDQSQSGLPCLSGASPSGSLQNSSCLASGPAKWAENMAVEGPSVIQKIWPGSVCDCRNRSWGSKLLKKWVGTIRKFSRTMRKKSGSIGKISGARLENLRYYQKISRWMSGIK